MGSVADQRMELKSTRTGNAFEYLTIDGERDLSVLHAQKFTTPTDGIPDENQLGILETFYQLLVKNNGSLEVKTSGTTGIPKRLTIVKDDLIASALLTGETFGLKEGDRVLHCLPTNFIAGK